MAQTRVLLVATSEVLTAGLRLLLDRDRSIDVVGAAEDATRASNLSRQINAHVIVMESPLAGHRRDDVRELIRLEGPNLGVLVVLTDPQWPALQAAVRLGARGFFLLSATGDDLRAGVKVVAQGGVAFDPRVTGEILVQVRQGARLRNASLSGREGQIMRRIASGLSDRAIAQDLGIGTNTVKTYTRRAMNKLGCDSRPEAAAAFARGLATSNGSGRSVYT